MAPAARSNDLDDEVDAFIDDASAQSANDHRLRCGVLLMSRDMRVHRAASR